MEFFTLHFKQTRFNRLSIVITVLLGLGVSSCDSGAKVAGTEDKFSTQINEVTVTKACMDTGQGIAVCPASDMAKIARSGFIAYEHSDLDWSAGALKLHGAKNETIALQLILTKTTASAQGPVSISFAEIVKADTMDIASTNEFSQSIFTAFYHPIDNAGYTWGPPTSVLPWPAEYPDALVPGQNACQPKVDNTSTTIALPENIGDNQSVWIDTYISRNTEPGTYQQNFILSVNETQVSLPISVTVHDATLPDKPSINAVGELYRTYILEGAGVDITDSSWRSMAQCYQRVAHQHRMVFIERLPDLLTTDQLTAYADIIDPALTGALFSSDNGYVGPGANTPVSIWKTPWPQTVDAFATALVSDRDIQRYRTMASTWDALVSERNWRDTDYFAYVFDEVDGPEIQDTAVESAEDYIKRVHKQMSDVQANIDEGSGSTPIDLLWTSHSNPAKWDGQAGLDLTGTIRLWAPNAGAADTQFLKERIDAGEQAWFYHHGHPSVGAHSINASGIEMRTWGVIGARYGFQGQLMWAVNLGSDDFPFRDPQFHPNEDRAGNGVLVYPGNQLDKIGYAKSPGPVPSMRLKAWRRGLQDAELYLLAQEQSPAEAQSLIALQMPSALTEGRDKASWSSDSATWIDFHKQLLILASQRSN